MKLTESKAEQILGIVFAVLGAVVAVAIIPWQIKDVEYDLIFNSPRFFPTVIAVLFIVLGVALFISGRGKRNSKDQETYSLEKKEGLLVLLTLVVMIVYTALLYFLPYMPVTMVTLGVLMYAYGQRDWRKIIIISIALPILIYVLFTYGLSLRMP